MDISNIDFSALFGGLTEASLNGNFTRVVEIASPVLWPMLVGSLPTMVVVWMIFYFPLKKIVERYHHRRVHRRKRSDASHAGQN